MKVAAALSAVMLLMSGCAYNIAEKGGIAAHKVARLDPAKFMPAKEQMEANKSRVVIFSVADKDPKAKRAGAGATATGQIEKYVLEAGSIELVDRESAAKLQGELQLIEMNGGELSGPQLADYAISGEITSVSVRSQFWPEGKPGKQLVGMVLSQLTGKEVKGMPEYEYSASIKGRIKIFQLPSGRLVKTLDMDDDKSLTKPGILGLPIPPALSSSEEMSLISGAAADAVESDRHDLKNFFARKGYILEKRVSEDGKHFIFLAAFGTGDGAKTGDEVVVYTLEENSNRLTGAVSLEEASVGKAVISDLVKSSECWIVVDDPKVAEKIRLGDFVKVQYSKGFGDYAKGAGKLLF